MFLFSFSPTELGDHQHGRVDRKTDIARHEGVRGQLRGQDIRRDPAVRVPDRGRQRAKSNNNPFRFLSRDRPFESPRVTIACVVYGIIRFVRRSRRRAARSTWTARRSEARPTPR